MTDDTVMTIRPRRSVLYMPGSNQRALEKAKDLPADALILDLEDAVAPEKKAEARDLVCAAARSGAYGRREVIIRINGLDTPWGMADLTAACRAAPSAILVPKVNGPGLIHEIEKLMLDTRPSDETAIWAMIETPRGVLHAEAIAAATPRLAAFVMGTNDLAKELRCATGGDRTAMRAALQTCVLAARAYEITVLDGVFNDVKDADGFRAEAEQGRDFGMDGKTLIHPSQIEPTNEVFAPAAADLDLARRQIDAFEQAQAEGKAVAVVDGRLVENLHVETARRLIAMDDAIKALAG